MANSDYFWGPAWKFGRSLHGWCTHSDGTGVVSACPCKHTKAVPCLLTHVGNSTVGTCPWEPECHFGAVRHPQLTRWEWKAVKWAAVSVLPLILLTVAHRGSRCSVALLQPGMCCATVRCSSIMNNPVIELVPLLCLSTVYKSGEAWNRHPCCSHHSHHCFIKKANSIFLHWLVVIQSGKRILQHSWRHMALGREGGQSLLLQAYHLVCMLNMREKYLK